MQFFIILDFEYNGVIVPQVGHYIYVARNQYKKIYRINEDEAKDLIYEDAKTYKHNHYIMLTYQHEVDI